MRWLQSASTTSRGTPEPSCRLPALVPVLQGYTDSRREMKSAAAAIVEEHRLSVFSSVPNLEDGLRWRKYGHKLVKGSVHPRSYYKCTTPGCAIQKHVEQSADSPDLFQVRPLLLPGGGGSARCHPLGVLSLLEPSQALFWLQLIPVGLDEHVHFMLTARMSAGSGARSAFGS